MDCAYSQKPRELTFINESDDYLAREKIIRAIRQLSPEQIPPVKVPFPPDVTPEELIRLDEKGNLRARATNKFLIYRSQYAKELRSMGYSISMRTVSALASKSWQSEPRKVQRKYEEIAKEVTLLRERMTGSLLFSKDPTLQTARKSSSNKSSREDEETTPEYCRQWTGFISNPSLFSSLECNWNVLPSAPTIASSACPPSRPNLSHATTVNDNTGQYIIDSCPEATSVFDIGGGIYPFTALFNVPVEITSTMNYQQGGYYDAGRRVSIGPNF